MSITIGDAILYIIGDAKQLDGTLKGVQGKIDKSLDGIQNSLNTWGNRLTVGLTLPIMALTKTALDHASSLNETIDKSRVVFEDSADEVEKFGDNAAKAMGMSKNTAMSAAATYGNLLRAVGVTTDKSAEMSMTLVQLAADLASFNNMDPTIVLDKLRAGLTGESEPLKVLGININEVRLKQKALELGLWDGVGALSASAKAQAAYAIMLEDSALAQGNFADTADSAANQANTLNSELEDLSATMGTKLLPLQRKLQGWGITLLEYFDELPESTQNVILGFIGFAAAAGPVGKALELLISPLKWIIRAAIPWLIKTAIPGLASGLAAGFGAISAPVWILIAAIGLLVALIYFLWDDVSKTLSMLAELSTAIIKRIAHDWFVFIYTIIRFMQDMASTVMFSFDQLFGGAYDTFMMIADIIAASLKRAGYEIDEFWEKIKDFARNLVNNVKSWFREVGSSIVNGIWEGIKSGWDWLTNMISSNMDSLLASVKEKLLIKSPSKLFANEVGAPMAQGIGVGFQQEAIQAVAQMAQMMTGMPGALVGAQSGSISIGHVEYHGRFSQSELAFLDRRQERMAENVTLKALRRMNR